MLRYLGPSYSSHHSLKYSAHYRYLTALSLCRLRTHWSGGCIIVVNSVFTVHIQSARMMGIRKQEFVRGVCADAPIYLFGNHVFLTMDLAFR